MRLHRFRWLMLSAVVALTGCPAVGAGGGGPTTRAELPHDVVVNLFQWNWRSVAAECPRLAAKGYAGVQVSPATEHVQVFGNPWWVDYQPVSYQLQSRRGDRAAYAAMIQACHAVGVRIYADAVINHMAGSDGGRGWAGTNWTHYDYPGLYQSHDFHHCGLTGDDDIRDYQSREQVQRCELSNLADLATDTEYVQGRIAAYLEDLVSLGVDGLRVDAVKHIPAADLAAILGRLSRKVDIYHEVIDKGGEPIGMGEYTGSGRVLVFSYGDQVGSAFQWVRSPGCAAWAAASTAPSRGSSWTTTTPNGTAAPRCSPSNNPDATLWQRFSCSPGPTANRS